MSDADVVVVGGGLAGAATALRLARRGHRVVVFEKARFPRDKVCGEGLMPHGVDELAALGVDLGRPFVGIAYHAGDRVAVGRFPIGQGRGVRRLELDARVLGAAVAAGVTLVDAAAPLPVFEAGAVRVGEVRARVLVAADGLLSPIRRALGLSRPTRRAPRYGARVHVHAPELPPRDVVDVLVGGRAEWYLTPVGDGVWNVALLAGKDVTVGFKGDLLGGMRALARGTMVEPMLGAEIVSAPLLTGPLRQRTRGVVAERAVLVGDAAGFVDAITGEGMSLGLVGARLAADAIDAGLRADRLGADDLRPYERARAAFARDAERLTEVVLWWLRHPRLARHVVGNLARNPATFGRMLAVNSCQRPLSSIGPRDWIRIAAGR